VIAVRVPASTANLGPGFDALGLALSLDAEVGTAADGVPEGATAVDERHPADIAFRRGGGTGPLWVRSPIPSGRGLGFSGAMRIGGLAVAVAQRAGGVVDVAAVGPAILEHAVELEGHADNVAASLHGGLVATAAGHAVRVPLGLAPTVVVWIPRLETSTQRSRHALPGSVSFADAAFNVGRTALLVAALTTGDVDALRWATADRLHQDLRFAASPPSRDALAAGLDAGAWCGWLSGSGPTVAFLTDAADAADAETLAAALPTDGHTKLLTVAATGVEVVEPRS
jgi:homoserine kinase